MATFWIATSLSLLAMTSGVAVAAINIPFTINLSETVVVTGTPRIAIDVGGNQRFANYTSGTGTNALIFTLSPNIGDVDLDGVTVSSPIDLNGGTIKDTAGNDATLTFTPPNTSGIKINYPSLGMDFTNGASGRYTLNGTVYNDISSFLTISGGSFTRASIGTYFDSTGTLQTASNNTPRFDYDPVTHAAKGILIEENRTNLITNSQANGAISGSPGTLPTNWVWAQMPAGLSAQILSTGVENGMNYIDVRISGTSAATNRPLLHFGSHPTTTSSIYTISFWFKCLAGSCPQIQAYALGANGWSMNATLTPSKPATSVLTKYFFTGMAVPTGGSSAYPMLDILTVNATGVTYDFSFRIAAPQSEQGAFATSYIPTTTAAVTRMVDVLTIATAGWYNDATGTYYADIESARMSNTFGGLVGGTSNDLQAMFAQSNSVLAGANPYASGSRAVGAPFKAAYAYWPSGLSLSINGSTIYNGGSQPANTPSTIEIMGKWQSQKTTGHAKHIKYYPNTVPNAQLQLLTQ